MGGAFKWPELEEIVEYRQKVKEVVLSVIDNTPLQLPVTQESPWVSPFCSPLTLCRMVRHL